MEVSAAPGAYSRDNEQQFRVAVKNADLSNLKKNRAIDRLAFLNADGKPGYLTVNSAGSVIWTAS